MRGNIRALLLLHFYRTEAESVVDIAWTATPSPILFPPELDLGVSSAVRCPAPHAFDSFGRSPMHSPRVHEIITERYGRSVKVQGIGPVSVISALRIA